MNFASISCDTSPFACSPRMLRWYSSLFICLALTGCSEMAMAKYVLCSPVSGTVYLSGVLVPNARVVRSYDWRWGKKSATDETITDKNGRFNLPEILGTSMSAWLPHEPYIEQSIKIYIGDQKYDVSASRKRNYEVNGEIKGKDLKLRIELTSEIVVYGNTAGRFTLEP